MALRLIEMILPKGCEEAVKKVLNGMPVTDFWRYTISEIVEKYQILVHTSLTELISDQLHQKFAGYDSFRIMLFSVEATLPEPDLAKIREAAQQNSDIVEPIKIPNRVSREELYYDISSGSEVSLVYLITVVLSSLVAAIGLIRSDVAIIVGAMVIAPLLRPNVALALADVLNDWVLAKKSIIANVLGFIVALVIATGIGYFVDFDPNVPEIASRTTVSIAHVVLALAAGTAGALAFTTGAPATLIGVMVAVALMPPLVALGLLLGAGENDLAIGALVLFLANVTSVNLSALVTFKLQGIKPREWWLQQSAKRRHRSTLAFWSMTVITLTIIILIKWSQGYFS